MGEITADVTVYNSITNNLGDEKLDSRAPFSLVEFFNYTGSLSKSFKELEAYNIYLKSWESVANTTLTDIGADIKSQFVSFLTELKLLYSSDEEKRYLSNINLNDDEQLSIAIPFFARKIKEISIYFNKKRKEINKDLNFTKDKGSHAGLLESIKNEMLDIYSGDDAAEGLTIPGNIGKFVDQLSIEIENKYDTFNDYYDLDPTKSPEFYDTLTGDRESYFSSNVNPISGAYFYDTERAIRDILNTQGSTLKEIPGLRVDYGGNDITSLSESYFIDYRNTDAANLRYLTQTELVEKFMGTDMYYLSCNSTNQILSGKMFDAQQPHRNLLNINNPGLLQIPGNEFLTERDVGLFFKPSNHGILKADSKFEPVVDRASIKRDTVYIYPDPTRYGNITGVGGVSRPTPFVFVLKNDKFKNESSSFGKSLVKGTNDDQNFYSYSSLEQDNYAQDNIKPFYGLETEELSGNIVKEVGDIYGNIFYIHNTTTSANQNLSNFTPTSPPLGKSETEFITLTADSKDTISNIRSSVKNILLYNTIKDKYENIKQSLSGVFSKYLYSTDVYNELTNNIIDIDIFKNTFYIRTPKYLIIDNIVYNDTGTFASKIFVSRVKSYNSAISTSLDRTIISNYSNPVRQGQQIFLVKAENQLTTSPLNNKTIDFSISKFNLDSQTETNIINSKTTPRSFFTDNFTFDVGTNIVQIKNMKLSFNKKQNKFFLLTDFTDLNNVHYYHNLIFEVQGNTLKLHNNFVITPTNDSLTTNFYKVGSLVDDISTRSLSSTPQQHITNGTFIF